MAGVLGIIIVVGLFLVYRAEKKSKKKAEEEARIREKKAAERRQYEQEQAKKEKCFQAIFESEKIKRQMEEHKRIPQDLYFPLNIERDRKHGTGFRCVERKYGLKLMYYLDFDSPIDLYHKEYMHTSDPETKEKLIGHCIRELFGNRENYEKVGIGMDWLLEDLITPMRPNDYEYVEFLYPLEVDFWGKVEVDGEEVDIQAFLRENNLLDTAYYRYEDYLNGKIK